VFPFVQWWGMRQDESGSRGTGPASRPLAQKHVGRAFAGDLPGAFIAQRAHVDAAEEMFAGTEQDR
jgi:hypothetical protein